MRRPRRSTRRPWPLFLFLLAIQVVCLAVVFAEPGWALWVGWLDGLILGLGVGASGLVRSYDESWSDFWETSILAYLFGPLALIIYRIRGEPPSGFFWVECVAGMVGYSMLFVLPMLAWFGVEGMIYFGTFLGWFFSGLLTPYTEKP